MKKSIYLLAVLGTLIAGCSGGATSSNSGSVSENIPNVNFAFSDLRLNLDSINQIGVLKNTSRPLGRKQSSVTNSTNQNESYLIGYNAQGEETPIVYLNSQNQEVQVPYSVFSFEVIGDFSYIVYYNSQLEYALNSLEDAIIQSLEPNSYATRPLGSTNFEVLIKQNGTGAVRGVQAYIVLHNKTGKLFDALATLSLEPYLDGESYSSVSLRLFTPYQDKIFYFARRKTTCKGELVFNESDNTLTKTEVCSPLDINPIFVHKTGFFAYTFDNKVSYASPDFSITGDLTPYFLSAIPERNMVFKSVGENIVMVSGKSPSRFVVFNGSFSLIEEKNADLLGGNNLSGFAWLFNKDGLDYFTINTSNVSVIYYVNFENFIFGSLIEEMTEFPALIQFSSQYKHIVFEGNLYQLGKNIRLLGDEDYTFSVLEQNIYEVINDIPSMIRTGYIEYTQTQGLTQINKSLNLQTGEIFLESESRPVITVTQVQPIN